MILFNKPDKDKNNYKHYAPITVIKSLFFRAAAEAELPFHSSNPGNLRQ
jgi:hypothetical protein